MSLTSGACTGTGGAELGTSLRAGASPVAPGNGADGDGSDPKDVGDVLGMTERSRGSLGDTDADQGLNLGGAGEGGSGISNVLFALLVTLLALALAVAVAVYRRGALPLLPPVPQVGRSGKPLLFLDVDGVIALSAFSGPLPPGRWHGPAEESVFV
ncbi:MAG: hypothetical protein QOD86_3129, partial [Miltoncostaeaceae bacterium]|nr:hypothetical protein [Miltoncostaeaceae bacterium]